VSACAADFAEIIFDGYFLVDFPQDAAEERGPKEGCDVVSGERILHLGVPRK